MDWINVEKQLPEIRQEVLIFDSDDGIFRAIYEGSYWSEQSTGCGCCSGTLTPTHWMPLPADPKDEL